MQSAELLAPYIALCVFVAAVGQFVMEVFGLDGEHDGVSLVQRFSLEFTIALAAVIIARYGTGVVRDASGALDLKRRLRLCLETLPQAKHGWCFAFQTAALTFAFGAMAHISVQDPTPGHDPIGWLICALIVTIAAALIARVIERRLPKVAAAIAALLLSPAGTHEQQFVPGLKIRTALPFVGWTPTLFNRPPPAIQL